MVCRTVRKFVHQNCPFCTTDMTFLVTKLAMKTPKSVLIPATIVGGKLHDGFKMCPVIGSLDVTSMPVVGKTRTPYHILLPQTKYLEVAALTSHLMGRVASSRSPSSTGGWGSGRRARECRGTIFGCSGRERSTYRGYFICAGWKGPRSRRPQGNAGGNC